jgi:hypothetical protein
MSLLLYLKKKQRFMPSCPLNYASVDQFWHTCLKPILIGDLNGNLFRMLHILTFYSFPFSLQFMGSDLKSWSSLPQELLDRIFQELDTSDYKHCQLTCRKWSLSARKYFYKSTKLTSVSQANAFVQALKASSTSERASDLVESLTLNKEIFKYPHVDSVFPQLLVSCHNLTKLWSSKQKGPFWTKLLQEYYEGNCPNLAYIPHPRPSTMETIQSYGYCIWSLRNTLKEICIFDYPTPTEGHRFKNQRDVEQLDKYPLLEKLCVYVKTTENFYHLPPIIKKGRLLNSLEIVTDTYPVSREAEDDFSEEEGDEIDFFQDNHDDNGDAAIDELLNDMHAISFPDSPDPLPKIKSFRCDKLMPVTSMLIDYLMNVFTGVDSLAININEEFDRYPMGDDDTNFIMPSIDKVFERKMEMEGHGVSSELWIEFLTHVYLNISSFTVSHLFVADIPNVLNDFMEAVDFNGTLDFRYKIDRTSSIIFEPYIGIYSEVDGIYFGKKQSAKKDGNINVIFDASFGCYENTLPHMEIIENLGEKVKSLEVDINQGNNLAEPHTDIYTIITGHFVDHIFQTCPLLKSLCIKAAHLVQCNQFPQINQSIKVLRLWECFMVPDILNQLSVRLPKLNYLIMNDCFFSNADYHCPIIGYFKSFAIDMPHTTLDTFYWSMSNGLYSSSKFYLRVLKPNAEKLHFVGDNSTVSLSTAEDFEGSLRNDSVLSIHIRCVDVKVIMIYTPDFRIVIKPGHDYKYRPLTRSEETHKFVKVLNKRFLA